MKIIVHTLDLLSDSEVSEEFDCDVEVEEEEEECLHEKQNNMLKFKCEKYLLQTENTVCINYIRSGLPTKKITPREFDRSL